MNATHACHALVWASGPEYRALSWSRVAIQFHSVSTCLNPRHVKVNCTENFPSLRYIWPRWWLAICVKENRSRLLIFAKISSTFVFRSGSHPLECQCYRYPWQLVQVRKLSHKNAFEVWKERGNSGSKQNVFKWFSRQRQGKVEEDYCKAAIDECRKLPSLIAVDKNCV